MVKSHFILIFGCLISALIGVAHAEPAAPTLDQCRAEIRANPGNPVAYYCIYRSVIAHGHFDEASKMLRHYFEENPEVYRIEMFIGWLDHMQNRPGFDAILVDAIDGMEATGDDWGVVYAGVERAARIADQGRISEAEALLERCRVAAQRTGDPTMAARVWTAWASMAEDRLEFSRALHFLLKARGVVFPDGPYDLQCWVMDNLGGVYWYLCRYPEAYEAFEGAFEIRRQAHDEYWQSLSAFNMALAGVKLMREGRMTRDRTRSLVARALKLAVESGNSESEASLLHLQGTIDRGEKGLALLRRSLEISRETGFVGQEIDNLKSIGTLLAEMAPQDRDEADTAFGEARRKAEDSGQRAPLGEVLAAEARIAALYDPPGEAIAKHLQALNFIEDTRTSQVGGSIRAQAFIHWAPVYYRLAGFLLEGVDGSSEGDQDLALAFETLERFRGRELLESLERAPVRGSGPLDQRHREALSEIAAIQRKLSKTDLAPDERRKVLNSLRELEERESVLRDQLLEEPSGSHRLAPSRIVDLGEVQSLLGPDEALLSYQLWDGEGDFKAPLNIGRSWLLLITRDHADAIAIPARRDLRGRVEILEGFMDSRGGNPGPGNKASVRLYGDLLREALDRLPGAVKKLVIIPDDVLFHCPFGGLRASERAMPIGSLYQISVLPSATVWSRLRKQLRSGSSASGALVFANPAIGEEAEKEFALRTAAPWREGLRLAPLKHAESEARALKRFAGAGTVILSGSEASESALKKASLASFRIIDFVTHAVVDDDQPERSAILLAPGSEEEDGFLQVREVTSLDLDGQLVILSSCRGSAGRVLGGEGAQSLARAFLQAGAGAVLAGLWPLDDEEASRFFSDLYRHLARGISVAEALRRAQAEAVDQGISSATWAGLSILGDGDLTPLKARKKSIRPWILIGIVGVAMVLGFGIRMRFLLPGGKNRHLPEGNSTPRR